jgi:hypothetical protein
LVVVLSIIILTSKPDMSTISDKINNWDQKTTLDVPFGWLFKETYKPNSTNGDYGYAVGGYVAIALSVIVGILFGVFGIIQIKKITSKKAA